MPTRNRIKYENLKEKFEKKVIPEMMKKFGYKNKMAVPKIEKVVVSSGIGKILQGQDPQKHKEMIKHLSNEIALITGQKPILTKAKKSISEFSIKKGSPVGLKVVLRRARMYHFLDRLLNFALLRKRDFKGINPDSIDKNQNLTIGIPEHIIFPEIQPEKSKVIFGLEVTIVTNAKTRPEAIELFNLLGFPFQRIFKKA